MTWEYFWAFYKKSDSTVREKMVFQILHEDWLFQLTEKAQLEVIQYAPDEFIKAHESKLQPSVLRDLKPKELIDWSRV